MTSRFSRDNISGNSGGLLVTVFLFPGMVFQWVIYIFVAGKRYGEIRERTRLARSPIMTWVYSGLFWVAVVGYLLQMFDAK